MKKLITLLTISLILNALTSFIVFADDAPPQMVFDLSKLPSNNEPEAPAESEAPPQFEVSVSQEPVNNEPETPAEKEAPPNPDIVLPTSNTEERSSDTLTVDVEETKELESKDPVIDVPVVVSTPPTTSETGPSVIIYSALPLIGLLYARKKKE